MSELTRTQPTRTADRIRATYAPQPLLVTRQACQMLGLGRTSVYHLVYNDRGAASADKAGI